MISTDGKARNFTSYQNVTLEDIVKIEELQPTDQIVFIGKNKRGGVNVVHIYEHHRKY